MDKDKVLKRAKGLLRISLLLANAYDKKRVADIIITEGFSVLGAHNGDIVLLDNKGNYQVLAYKGYPKAFLKKWSMIPKNTPLISSLVIETKKPHFISSVASLDEKYEAAKSFLTTSKAESLASIPLKTRNNVIGIMQFTFQKSQKFSREDKIFMITLANQCAQAFERVEAIESLKNSKEQLEVILRNTADAIFVQNQEGTIIYANDAAAALLQYKDPAKLQNQTFHDVFRQFEVRNENDEKLTESALLLGVHKQKRKHMPYTTTIKLIRQKTKAERWFHVKSTKVYDYEQAISLIITTMQDITEAKELDQRKDDFINIASHELRTPLTSLQLFLALLSKNTANLTESKAVEYLKRINEQSTRLQSLVTDLLDVSRIKSGKMKFIKEEIQVDQLLAEAVSDIQITTKKHTIVLKKNTPVRVSVDRLRLYQVITNFLSNAIKYSPGGGKIVITSEKKNNEVVVSVQDFGIGIPGTYQKKVFAKHYQVEKAHGKLYSGLGMGLYIAQEVIARHKGKVWVESKKGKGSTFYFSLPVRMSPDTQE